MVVVTHSTCLDRLHFSHERTFSEINQPEQLLDMCKSLCEAVAKDAMKKDIQGKCLTLKIKSVSFEVRQRSVTLADAVSQFDVIWGNVSRLLQREIRSHDGNLRLRLMGVRLSQLGKQAAAVSVADMLAKPAQLRQSAEDPESISEQKQLIEEFVCPVCGDLMPSVSLSEANRHVDACLSPSKASLEAPKSSCIATRAKKAKRTSKKQMPAPQQSLYAFFPKLSS